MLQETAARLTGEQFAPAIVVSGEQQRFFIKRQLEHIGVALDAILLEPVGRNTSAAAALAAAWLHSTARNELMLLMPSDHVIGDREAFLRAITVAVPHAEEGRIVTFGAQPTEPNTQYGYIEADSDRAFADGAYPIVHFHEKPNAANAAEYLATGRFFWNCGIFLTKASTLVDEMRQFLPSSLHAITRAVSDGATDGLFVRPSAEAFAEAENISIDNGIMERTSRGVVVPVQMDWSDVGAWDAVWKVGEKDTNGNVTWGDVVAIDSRNSLLRSAGRAVIAAVGLEDMAVIAVNDAMLVAPIGRASEIKEVVAQLKAREHDYTVLPTRVPLPWGSHESLAEGPRFHVKHIVVDPGECISLQMHTRSSKHWIVVQGSAEVTIGGARSLLEENQSSYIRAGTKHRLANPGKVPVELIEIQCGPYLREDDIVRFDDQYGRT